MYGQKFNADGTIAGPETRVNTTTFGNQLEPVVTTLDNGNFVVGWQGFGNAHSDVFSDGIFARLFDNNFQPLTGETQVRNVDFGGDRHFDIAALPGGQFVFALQSSAIPDDNGIYVRRFNNDGLPDTILDAEIAGFETLVDELIDLGLGDDAQVSLVSFSTFATRITPDLLTPNQDDNGNGIPDIKDALRGLQFGGGTDYEAALQEAISVFGDNPADFANRNVIFLSDGEPNGGPFADEAVTLRGLAINVRAFGVGNDASLAPLQEIDPNAEIFTSTNELLGVFGGIAGGSGGMGGGGGTVMEPGFAGVTVFLDRNNNGQLDASEESTVSNPNNGSYTFQNLLPGTYVVRVIVPAGFRLTTPMAGFHQITIDAGDVDQMLVFGFAADDAGAAA